MSWRRDSRVNRHLQDAISKSRTAENYAEIMALGYDDIVARSIAALEDAVGSLSEAMALGAAVDSDAQALKNEIDARREEIKSLRVEIQGLYRVPPPSPLEVRKSWWQLLIVTILGRR